MVTKSHKGFTLVELITVIVIIGVLGSIAIPRFSQTIAKAHYSRTVKLLYQIDQAEAVYEATDGAYVFASNNSEFETLLGVSTNSAPNFTFTVSPLSSGKDYSAKAELRSSIGDAVSGEYIRIDKNFNKWYHGTATFEYARNFLEQGISE